MTFARESAITGQLPIVNGLLNKLKLFPGEKWTIEWNMQKAGPSQLTEVNVKLLLYPRLATMSPTTTNMTPRIFGKVTLSWKRTALKVKTSTKAKLIKG